MDFFIILILLWIAITVYQKIKQRQSKQFKHTSKKYPTQNHYCSYTKKPYITPTEMRYAYAIQKAISANHRLLPQVCLGSILEKHSDSKYQSELFRMIDFGIFDENFNVLLLIEIHDSTHNQPDRIERDHKVKEICKMANIPLITFWTKYGVDEEYIQRKIKEYL